jgi:hypothetical protein
MEAPDGDTEKRRRKRRTQDSGHNYVQLDQLQIVIQQVMTLINKQSLFIKE